MGSERTSEVDIDGLLRNIKTGKWRIPKFQREFVWTVQMIEDLINSVFDARPLGMVTLWEMESSEDFQTERISLEDSNEARRTFFGDDVLASGAHLAILDGRQRCTSLAMAFGGLKQENKQRRFAGTFYLSLLKEDETSPVKFFKSSDIAKMGLDSFANSLSKGYLQLAPSEETPTVKKQLMKALRIINDEEIYAEPLSDDEMVRRIDFLESKTEKILDTRVAVYTVPAEYNLQEICEIFETLNTTGTKVSTVDLVHSFLYSDTYEEGNPDSGKNLRGWLDALGEMNGARGWSDSNDRPELILQFAAAIYLAFSECNFDVPSPRKVGGRDTKIENVKNGSLLALPAKFWVDMMKDVQTETLRMCILEFQELVGEGLFPYKKCPYPISAGLYIALRFVLEQKEDQISWNQAQLRALYKSFFWRNALANRYDQGFLTRMTYDLKELVKILEEGASLDNKEKIESYYEEKLDLLFERDVMYEKEQLEGLALDGTLAGAIRSSIELRLYSHPKRDLLDPEKSVEFDVDNDVQMHHIFPKKWVKSNRSGELKKFLEAEEDVGKKPENSAANLMPLTASSNGEWLDNAPRAVLEEKDITFKNNKEIVTSNFIDETCFAFLSGEYPPDNGHVIEFWKNRAKLISEDIYAQLVISISG